MYKNHPLYYISGPYRLLMRKMGYSRTLLYFDICKQNTIVASSVHCKKIDDENPLKIAHRNHYKSCLKQRLNAVGHADFVVFTDYYLLSPACLVEWLWAKILKKHIIYC